MKFNFNIFAFVFVICFVQFICLVVTASNNNTSIPDGGDEQFNSEMARIVSEINDPTRFSSISSAIHAEMKKNGNGASSGVMFGSVLGMMVAFGISIMFFLLP